METDDHALLAAVAGGSERAFNMLIERHQQALRLFLRGLTSNHDDADDVAQETFLALWTQAKSFKGEATVKSWLFSIGWRKMKDSQRRWFRRAHRDAAFHELKANTAQNIAPEDKHALNQALDALPLDQRAAVMLCLASGLSHSEAADILNSPLGTVKSHVLRGRARLAELLR